MRSSSDGAMADRARACFDAGLQRLQDSTDGRPATTSEARATPPDDAGSGRQRQQGGRSVVASFPVATTVLNQGPGTSAAAETQPEQAPRAPGSRTSNAANTPSRRPIRKRLSIPRVSQMFIQAVQSSQSPQTQGDQRSGVTTPSSTRDVSRNGTTTNSTTADDGSFATVYAPPGSPGVVEEGSSICGGKNSTAEFGEKYAVLRVKVKRSYRKRRMEVKRQLDEKLWSREVPYVPKVEARSVEPNEVPQKAQSPPTAGPPKVVPWTDEEEAFAFQSVNMKVESPIVQMLPDSDYDESCMNAFWCLCILGFLFPPLWVAGSCGVLATTRCGFIAGMINVAMLMVAGITVAIFIA